MPHKHILLYVISLQNHSSFLFKQTPLNKYKNLEQKRRMGVKIEANFHYISLSLYKFIKRAKTFQTSNFYHSPGTRVKIIYIMRCHHHENGKTRQFSSVYLFTHTFPHLNSFPSQLKNPKRNSLRLILSYANNSKNMQQQQTAEYSVVCQVKCKSGRMK